MGPAGGRAGMPGNLPMKNDLYVVGAGPGSPVRLTAEAAKIISEAGCVVAAPRHACLAGNHGNVVMLRDFAGTFGRIEEELKRGSVVVLVSGDPGIYSLLALVRKKFAAARLRVVPGISSLQSLCCEIGESWEDAVILSGHGRSLGEERLLTAADRTGKVIFFCGSDRTPGWVCKTLERNGLGGLEVIVGERLSYPDQRISRGTPAALARLSFDDLSLALIRNAEPWKPPFGRLKDEDFVRSGVPMTKGEVRSIILDKLELAPDSIFWDIGAGTGSIAVSAALACPEGQVHAVESDPLAVELEKSNKKKFHCFNMKIHQGRCPAAMEKLPRPTRVFIGGSGGELREILSGVASRGKGIRVVVAAVSMRTICAASEVLESEFFSSPEVTQLTVSKSKAVGNSKIMVSQNPITIFSAWTAEKEGGKKK